MTVLTIILPKLSQKKEKSNFEKKETYQKRCISILSLKVSELPVSKIISGAHKAWLVIRESLTGVCR